MNGFNPDFTLHIETMQDGEEQKTLVSAKGSLTGIGRIIVFCKALEALEFDDTELFVAILAYRHKDEIPETKIDLFRAT